MSFQPVTFSQDQIFLHSQFSHESISKICLEEDECLKKCIPNDAVCRTPAATLVLSLDLVDQWETSNFVQCWCSRAWIGWKIQSYEFYYLFLLTILAFRVLVTKHLSGNSYFSWICSFCKVWVSLSLAIFSINIMFFPKNN